jgi:hypothetical protein
MGVRRKGEGEVMMLFEWICAAEDLWTWSALLCGNHMGGLVLWMPA